jgi:murein DD-endopeptidase MepM/ murein hydrolase activator NlpD
MSCVLEMLRARCWPRVAALALTTIGVAACSGDASRFNESPFSSVSTPEATGSIAQGAPVSRVESRPLAPQPAQLSGTGNPGAPSGSKSAVLQGPTQARANAAGAPDATRSVVRRPTPNANWSWDGGTAVTVAPGETVDAIARRYGVPASVIMQANNIASPAIIYPGQRLVIPRYTQAPVATAAAAPAVRPASPPPAPATAPAPVAAATPASNAGVHVVAAGETLSKIARRYNKAANEIAKANNIQSTATLNVGDRLVIPGGQAAAGVKPTVPAGGAAKPAPSAAVKETEPAQSAAVIAPAADSLDKDAAKLAEGTGALPKFRWPANGRVIAGYGPTPNGQQNDGINIALPENTPVKAAEDGVVAYAGNELKGYGNLVLVRHPNGYVTAYAHAKELLVKRGDQVKRGQVIARSGQTGNVNAPQLHFEIRKGASPLDPTRFLNGA